MRVLVAPRAGSAEGDLPSAVARSLAGPGGEVIFLGRLGVRNLARPLTAAELTVLRAALAGAGPVVGYVCRGAQRTEVTGGKPPSAAAVSGEEAASACHGQQAPQPHLVAVTDHADLAGRSPLTGPNDDLLGPRFPSLAGVYAPEVVLDRVGGTDGMIVRQGVVAGVEDDQALLPFEAQTMAKLGWQAASSELVTPVIVAAHLGLRVAALVVVWQRPSDQRHQDPVRKGIKR